jgi:hypothetical protein
MVAPAVSLSSTFVLGYIHNYIFLALQTRKIPDVVEDPDWGSIVGYDSDSTKASLYANH